MSTSIYSGVILGVKISEIGFKAECMSNKFEIHDKKGNPTGKFETETSWKISFNNQEKTVDKLYEDIVSQLIDTKNPLTIINCNNFNDDNFDIDKVIIGIEIAKNGYDSWYKFKEIEPNFDSIKTELKNQFDVDVQPKLYYYLNTSY
mgnify:CR=1 FL=1